MFQEHAAAEEHDAGDRDQGGDPACWLDRVCPECGRFVTQAPRPARCPVCDGELPE